MDRGGCQMNGGSGPEQPGMVTLEDLESFSEDQLEDSGTDDEAKAMDDDRLLHYWQDVARGHQVEVAEEMAEPIQQLTTNNQGRSNREVIPFTLLGRKEKQLLQDTVSSDLIQFNTAVTSSYGSVFGRLRPQCGELLWEKRHYEKGHWACVKMSEATYEQSICYGFMKLMRYICQQNSLGDYLGMTLPIITVVRTNENHSVIAHEVTVAYFLPIEHQAQPPQPTDNEIAIEVWPATAVYTRPFTGPTNEVTIVNQINAMTEQLDFPGVSANDSFIVAGYTNPAHINRQNEIWFLERP